MRETFSMPFRGRSITWNLFTNVDNFWTREDRVVCSSSVMDSVSFVSSRESDAQRDAIREARDNRLRREEDKAR